jgi:hypothetical protein
MAPGETVEMGGGGFDRRTLLRRGFELAVAVTGATVLGACGGGNEPAHSQPNRRNQDQGVYRNMA